MAYKYSRYIDRVTQQPWAITLDKLREIRGLMLERLAGHRPSDEDIAARLGEDVQRAPAPQPSGTVAVIPIHGTIAHRADMFMASSGGTSCEQVSRQLKRALSLDEIGAIVLDFDSPGGSVAGLPELAAQIAKTAKVKPVIAHVNAVAASAAYWLASQCTEIVCTESGQVGSIGVFMLHIDESEKLAKDGYAVTPISAGDYKLEGAWWAPLSDEAKAFYQKQVDATYAKFVADVAKGRGITVAAVKKDYGQGRSYRLADALSRGMVDRKGTLDETIDRLLGRKPARAGAKAEDETLPIQGVDEAPDSAGTRPGDSAGSVAAAKVCADCGRQSCPCMESTCAENCSTCDPKCSCVKASKAGAAALAAGDPAPVGVDDGAAEPDATSDEAAILAVLGAD